MIVALNQITGNSSTTSSLILLSGKARHREMKGLQVQGQLEKQHSYGKEGLLGPASFPSTVIL